MYEYKTEQCLFRRRFTLITNHTPKAGHMRTSLPSAAPFNMRVNVIHRISVQTMVSNRGFL